MLLGPIMELIGPDGGGGVDFLERQLPVVLLHAVLLCCCSAATLLLLLCSVKKSSKPLPAKCAKALEGFPGINPFSLQ